MSVILLRHTRLAAVEGLCYGRTDVALADTFAEEAEVVRASFSCKFRTVWTSPSRRCVAMAELLAKSREGGPTGVRTDARLMELNFGAWENRPWVSFRGPESEAWALDPWTLAPPEGESGAALWARVAGFRAELLAGLYAGANGADAAPVLVVTHAGVIRVWLGLERGLSWAEAMRLPVPHGSLTVIDLSGRQTT